MEEIKNWVVQINGELKGNNGPSCEEEQWKRPSIYKIPSYIPELNKNAFVPQAVSFGPYHHGKDHLKTMEEHKHRALLHFLKRCNKPIELVFQRMEQVVQELKDSYKPLDPTWAEDPPRFLKLMILDGCFMLEILRDCVPDDYADNDPVFSEHGELNVMPYIQRDMLLLENQLPMLVLHTLLEVESDKTLEDEFLNEQIMRFLSPGTTITEKVRKGKCVHALDIYRRSLIQHGPSHRISLPEYTATGDDVLSCSATELHEAGIRFGKSMTRSLGDVSFDGGVLRLPTVVVDDGTESTFLNLMAFERLHVAAYNEVTNYVYFMDTIIDDENDVALLEKKGILIEGLGCRKEVARLFNSLAKGITTDQRGVWDVVLMSVHLSNYCKKPWSRWRANFIHTYLKNPWVATSVIAAIFLFALTIIQTGYSVASYYKGGGGS